MPDMTENKLKGKVILAAAGPGDPDLVTMKTAQFLGKADVILTDRLVSKDILTRYANPLAKIVEVGKQSRRESSTPQSVISTLLLEYAVKDNLVVRLKGGDVSIYSNILDELETLYAYQIPFEIIPGVTAALGASAYAGIPLTGRGYSTGVRLLTFYQDHVISEKEWYDLANTGDTLVFYMSSHSLSALAARLLESGMKADRPIAVIEQATTPSQRVFIKDIQQCSKEDAIQYVSPTLIIIGDVVKLHAKFAWYHATEAGAEYFESLPEKVFSSTVQRADHDS
jgi:uroporphyrin-III C-methyltransferase/precorrin-2 dehydrogenase/sirohydrochlorin ferrochelatase/uroporphyrin-III C-methyltransferase